MVRVALGAAKLLEEYDVSAQVVDRVSGDKTELHDGSDIPIQLLQDRASLYLFSPTGRVYRADDQINVPAGDITSPSGRTLGIQDATRSWTTSSTLRSPVILRWSQLCQRTMP
jgi:hypothetical protein